ncbi:hypothetical protein DFJ73DRAFT_819163 [Zopfochytrium polystomum]|nr:hypothetical protein DFJ73DRAFT_819163 [Zopfochytrium polystomum]
MVAVLPRPPPPPPPLLVPMAKRHPHYTTMIQPCRPHATVTSLPLALESTFAAMTVTLHNRHHHHSPLTRTQPPRRRQSRRRQQRRYLRRFVAVLQGLSRRRRRMRPRWKRGSGCGETRTCRFCAVATALASMGMSETGIGILIGGGSPTEIRLARGALTNTRSRSTRAKTTAAAAASTAVLTATTMIWWWTLDPTMRARYLLRGRLLGDGLRRVWRGIRATLMRRSRNGIRSTRPDRSLERLWEVEEEEAEGGAAMGGGSRSQKTLRRWRVVRRLVRRWTTWTMMMTTATSTTTPTREMGTTMTTTGRRRRVWGAGILETATSRTRSTNFRLAEVTASAALEEVADGQTRRSPRRSGPCFPQHTSLAAGR